MNPWQVIALLGLFLTTLCGMLASQSAQAQTGTWAAAASLNAARSNHTATLLPSGKVLVAGGATQNNDYLASAELYDPASNTWSAAGSLVTARHDHTATLLPSGKVLVVGGFVIGGNVQASAELYDPASNTWSAAGSLTAARSWHTATLLASGKVLVAGGTGATGAAGYDLASAELYDPTSNTWSAAGSLTTERARHTATLLASGKVLVASGTNHSGDITSAELYDPATNTWSSAGSMATGRQNHTATLLPSGKVLVVGGLTDGFTTYRNAELYDPASNSWSGGGLLSWSRWGHTAALLPSGQVLVVGGTNTSGVYQSSTAELYDPANNTWLPALGLTQIRFLHSATLLPSGKVLMAGGSDGSTLASAELYDPASANWSAAGSLMTARQKHIATLLPSGKVLIAGGGGSHGGYDLLASAELYDPESNNWSFAGSLAMARIDHTGTLLPSGKVLVAGGADDSGYLVSAELYNPESNSWSSVGDMTTARRLHTATLLPSGKVLVVAGSGSGNNVVASAELYDPASNTWSSAGSLMTARYLHTATLLPSGKVLVVGGSSNGTTPLASAELYDPASNTWSPAGSLTIARFDHTATLLGSGKLLVVGGWENTNSYLASAELYDPESNTWLSAGSLAMARIGHTATLLPSGQTLVAGGVNNGGCLASAELYDPVSNTWSDAGNLATARLAHTATLLLSGKVLFEGGYNGNTGIFASAAELADPGLTPVAQRQPNLSATSPFLLRTSALAATAIGSATDSNGAIAATGFRPRFEASGGGSNNSATNASIFQVQRIDNDQMLFVANGEAVSLSDTNFTGSASAFAGFPAGPVRIRAWVNGVPSAALYTTLAVTPGKPATPSASGGALQATISFAAGIDTGGAPITSYVATASPGGATASCTAPCASVTFNSLPPGVYTFVIAATNAAGRGPASAASNSATVTQATPMLAWPSPTAITYGTALGAAQLNATASFNNNPVAGTFTYTPAVGTVLHSGANQTLSVSFAPSDATNYSSPVNATTTITVNPATTTLAITAPSAITLGNSVSVATILSVTSPGAVGTPTGTITIDDGIGEQCQIVLPATSCSLTPTNAGTLILTAAYAGAGDFAGSSATTSLGVRPATTQVTLTSAPNPSTVGQAVTFTATVSVTASATTAVPSVVTAGGGAAVRNAVGMPASSPTGSITFADGATVLATVTLNASGMATYTTTALSQGRNTITATYSGDSNNAGAVITQVQQVNAAVIVAPTLAPWLLVLLSSLLACIGGSARAIGRDS